MKDFSDVVYNDLMAKATEDAQNAFMRTINLMPLRQQLKAQMQFMHAIVAGTLSVVTSASPQTPSQIASIFTVDLMRTLGGVVVEETERQNAPEERERRSQLNISGAASLDGNFIWRDGRAVKTGGNDAES